MIASIRDVGLDPSAAAKVSSQAPSNLVVLRRPLEPKLAATIAMMDEPTAMDRPSIVQSLFQGIEDEAGMRGAADPPADNAPSECIDDERTYTKPCQVAT